MKNSLANPLVVTTAAAMATAAILAANRLARGATAVRAPVQNSATLKKAFCDVMTVANAASALNRPRHCRKLPSRFCPAKTELNRSLARSG